MLAQSTAIAVGVLACLSSFMGPVAGLPVDDAGIELGRRAVSFTTITTVITTSNIICTTTFVSSLNARGVTAAAPRAIITPGPRM